MKNRIRLSLTGVGEVLKKEAEERLDEDDVYQIPTCSAGNTQEFYEDVGIPLPQDLVDKLKKKDNGVEFGDEDYEEVYSDVVVYEDEIRLIVTSENFTTIFLRDGLTITVQETAEEIDLYLDLLEMTWFDKLKQYIKLIIK